MVVLALLGFSIFLAPCASAQSTFGTILGTVRDPQGAAIAGARIQAENMTRGTTLSTTSDEAGSYTLYPVPEGRYRVTAEAGGFQRRTLEGVQVDLDSRIRADVELAVSAIEQSITVQAAATELQRDSGGLESVIENQQIIELPLDGRNILDLAYLAPGATKNVTNAGLGDFATNGNRPYGNSFVLDGVSTRDEIRGQSGVAISVDAVQQFKMKNSNATAEYGGGGTQMALIVKSGTNQLHGSAFLFNRTTLAQARSFFSRSSDLPPFKRNQFGGSFGGPVRRNRTFYFVNYEGSLVNTSASTRITVPTPAMREGNFEGVRDIRGNRLTLAVPTAMPWQLAGQPLYLRPNVVNPFYLADAPGNPNRRNAAFAKAFLGYYEQPNAAGDTNNFTSERPNTTNAHQVTWRLDHQLTTGQNASVRQTIRRQDSLAGNFAAYAMTGIMARNANNGVASLTSVLKPTLVNEFRFGWNWVTEDETVTPTRDLIRELGIPEPQRLADSPLLQRLPTITFAGNGSVFGMGYRANIGGDATPQIFENGNQSWANTTTWQRGRHEIKGGFQYRRIPINYVQVAYPRGLLTYNGRAAAMSTGFTIADALLGMPASSTFTLYPQRSELRAPEFSAFLQDDWRITSRLTMNYGVRWEARRPAYEIHGQMSAFNLETGKIVTASDNGKISDRAYPALLSRYSSLIVTADQAGWDPKYLTRTDWLNLGPRFGFAYTVNQKGTMVVRGAYGIFYSFPPYFVTQNSNSLPFGGTSAANSTVTDVLSNENPFRLGLGGRPAMNAVNFDFRTAYNQQWNLTIERLLFRQAVFSVSYVGNKGVHLMGQQQRNPGNRVYPDFGGINEYISDFNSIYNSMQVEVRRRYSKGFFYQFNWTWAKSIDDMGGAVGNAGEDAEVRNLNRRLNRANSDFVNRHVMRGNFLWELPFGRKSGIGAGWHPLLKATLGQWSLGGIAQFNTGVFATPRVVGGTFNGRPDVVSGVNWRLSDSDREELARRTGDTSYLDRSQRWFNPFAFAIVDVQAGRVGNAGRNTIVGPSFFNFDSVVSKRFRLGALGESTFATVRIEAFNVTNHVNFHARQMDVNINSATAGAFSQILGNPRQLQFGFRLDF